MSEPRGARSALLLAAMIAGLLLSGCNGDVQNDLIVDEGASVCVELFDQYAEWLVSPEREVKARGLTSPDSEEPCSTRSAVTTFVDFMRCAGALADLGPLTYGPSKSPDPSVVTCRGLVGEDVPEVNRIAARYSE